MSLRMGINHKNVVQMSRSETVEPWGHLAPVTQLFKGTLLDCSAVLIASHSSADHDLLEAGMFGSLSQGRGSKGLNHAFCS